MNIALVAHNSKKELMQNFCIAYCNLLAKHDLYATGSTGKCIEDVTNLSIHKFIPGHLGGVKQLASEIECNVMDAVIFLRDPVNPGADDPDCSSVYRLCDANNIPLATNVATAEIIVLAIDRGDLDWREAYK